MLHLEGKQCEETILLSEQKIKSSLQKKSTKKIIKNPSNTNGKSYKM